MSRFIFANADRASFRTEQRRRERDIAFLERLRTATHSELDRMTWDYRNGPEWVQVAIARAIQRVAKDGD